ncbi:MAG: hypothetical protein IT560_03985 [Alphaproteobacteria bacterium]|nr:hypothetical protein [Alphaproteobacteria bacterium]
MPDQQVSQFLKQEAPKEFDFEQAVADARRDYPKQTANLTFIDTSAPDFAEKLEEFAKKAKLTNAQYNHILKNAESSTALATEMNGHDLMLIPVRREGEKQSFPGDDFKSAYFCFQHELGHFVVKDAQGIGGGTGQYKENAADSFAMIRGLKDGVFKKSDLLALADKRGQEMLMTMDFDHMTAMSLDAIAINPKNIDFISLTPKEIAKVAERHADTFGAGGRAESKFSKMQGKHGYTTDEYGAVLPEVIEAKLLSLQEIAMSSPAKSQEFYIAARILNNVLETGTIKLGGLEHKVDVNTDHWKDAKKALMEKAGDRDIGGKKAQATVSLTRPEKKSAFARIVEPLKPMKI